MRDSGNLTPISRRGFVQCALCAAAGTTLAGYTSRSGQTSQAGREVWRELPYGAVRLTRGALQRHFESIYAHYLALDDDRLLKVFRQRAGLPAPGRDMGGWYDTNGFVPGLTLGQYISGLARLGAATGDRAAHAKVARLVSGFGEFVRRADSPYAGPNAQAQSGSIRWLRTSTSCRRNTPTATPSRSAPGRRRTSILATRNTCGR